MLIFCRTRAMSAQLEKSQSAYRGLITDRNGEPLAVSTPVISLVADPKAMRNVSEDDLVRLSDALGISVTQLTARLNRFRKKSFMYLARQLPVNEAEKFYS